ncbi:Athe_2463 domain-containing protein [Paenibacillus vietnamensis]|uniref:Athe_2463 domain-containing protein n=1 Tax=Paenibacillus vietnamensis TaxID=2590547 RepID=UPI0037CB430A
MNLIVYGDYSSIPERSQDFKRGWQTEENLVINPEPSGEGHYYAYTAKYGGYKFGEYRYLGYTIDGTLFPNSYFIVDDDVGAKLGDKHWVFQPWKSLPTSYRHKPETPGFLYLNYYDNTIDERFSKLFSNIQRSLNFTITQGVKYSDRYKVLSQTPENMDPRNYMVVNQPATAREAGFGTMYHYSWASHSLWYQTFTLEKLKGPEKTAPPAACTATAVEKQPIPIGKERKVKVQVKVTGTLQDQLYYGSLPAEALFYTRKEVKHWQLNLYDRDKDTSLDLASNNKSDGVIVKDNTGTGVFTIEVDTDKLDKTDPKAWKYSTDAKAVAFYANDTAAVPSKSGSPVCYLNLTFKGNEKGTMESGFNVIPQVQFTKKSEFDKERIGYQDLSYGKDADYYIFEISNDEDGTKATKTFDPAIPEIQKPSAGYLDQDAVRTFLHDYIKTKFSESSSNRRLKTFHIKQTIVDKDEPVNNRSVAMKTVVVIQDAPVEIIGGCSNPDAVFPPAPPQYIQPEASWPLDWYDVVPFPVTDAAPGYIPAPSCKAAPGYESFSKKAFVDGKEIDVKAFFKGEYVFGEAALGIREVKVVWTAPDGTESFLIRHVVIHESKPRVSLTLEGAYKQNRTMMAYDRSAASNDQWVEGNAPLEITNFSFVDTDNPGLKCRTGYCESNLKQKMFMYKTPGSYRMSIAAKRVIPYGNGKSITRYSDPYVVDYEILPDHKPAIVAHAYGSQISRLDELQLYYDVQSTDEDYIASRTLKVLYDADNDGTFETDVYETAESEPDFPAFTKLGQYRIVVNAKEGTNQARLSEFITPADDQTHTFASTFFVDNYEPSSDLYLEVPNEKPDLDVFFMLDSNLSQSSADYVKNNKVTITNAFTTAGMLANIGIWDMKTYTYDQPASTYRSTGSSYPPSTTVYSSSGYSGTLSRTSVSNSPYTRDEGRYVSKTDSKTATDSCSNTVTTTYNSNGFASGSSSWSECPGSKSYSDGSYSGTLSRTGSSASGSCPTSGGPKNGSCSVTWTASYSGTVYWTRNVWEPRMVSYDDYTGYYSGTIYKDVRQPYDASFLRAVPSKYVVYLSDHSVSQLPDLQQVMDKQAARLIFAGSPAIQEQMEHDKYIPNGKAIEQLIGEVIDYIGENNPAIPKVYKLAGEEVVTHTATFDYEQDSIGLDELQIIQDPDHFDNSLGYDQVNGKSLISEKNAANWMAYRSTLKLNKPGKYIFFRRVKDMPAADPLFADYAYYSNESAIEVFVHRKPVADVSLDFDYQMTSNTYRTNWIDTSYDLDHSVTRADTDRGIQDRAIKFTNQATGEAFTQIPSSLPPGTYVLDYRAQDLEGAWSDPVQRTFVLPDTVPVQLKGRLKTAYSGFSLNGVPAGESLIAHELWTRYPYAISLAFAMGTQISRFVPFYTGSKSGNDVSWNDETFTIPVSTPDGLYTFKITGNGSVAGSTAEKSFQVQVATPIQLTGTIHAADGSGNGISTLVTNEGYSLKAETTKYANAVTVTTFKGTTYQRTVALSSSTTQTAGYGQKSWSGSFQTGAVPNGLYTFEWRATTPNGNVQTVSKTVEIVNNRPPAADFDWSPKPVYEGDTVSFRSAVNDQDGNELTIAYRLTNPNGTHTSYSYTSAGPGYSPEGPTVKLAATGTWTMRMTVSDGIAEPVIVTKTVQVLPLSVSGRVKHTELWDEHRRKYNMDRTGRFDSPRVYSVFWAGERFMLEANTTVTGTATGADRVEVSMGDHTVVLNPANAARTSWKGVLWDESFAEQPDGKLTFVFRAYYSNGVVKNNTVEITLDGSVQDIAGVHRVH